MSNQDEGPPSLQSLEEVPLHDVLKLMLSNPELSDLSLKSKIDGTLIKIHRVILATRSPVFYGMLCGSFVESTQSVIELNYSGKVLRALVEYIYTDDPSLLKNNQQVVAAVEDTQQQQQDKQDLVSNITSLIEASKYYGLPILSEKAISFASSMIDTTPSLAVLWLAACDTDAALKDSSLKSKAFEKIRTNPQILIDGHAACMLSYSAVERILKCDTVNADEFMLFKILNAWAGNPEHKRKAEELTRHVALERIDPTDLSNTVTCSGIVSSNQLLEAFKQQALTAKTHLQPSFKRRRLIHAVWESSNNERFTFPPGVETPRTEVLNCEPTRPGNIYKWSILFEELTGYIELGIVSTENQIDRNKWLSSYKGKSWLLFSTGSSYRHDGVRLQSLRNFNEELSFRSGSTVHFSLDLSGQGLLEVSVDDKTPVTIDSDVLSNFIDASLASLFPAISFRTKQPRKCTVQFLGFQ